MIQELFSYVSDVAHRPSVNGKFQVALILTMNTFITAQTQVFLEN